MEPRTLEFVTEACEGQLVAGNAGSEVKDVSIDSRAVKTGELFIAIKGEKFDGHDYLNEVAAKGAGAMVVERPCVPKSFSGGVVEVDSTRRALLQLAARYRKDFELPLIAVCGSNGKTTTKNLIGAILRSKFPTLNSEASFNNDIGVPVTLLRLTQEHRAAVLEAGSNHPGELRPLLDVMAPCLGVLTSIGREHLEFFHDLNGVVEEEGTLVEALPLHGKIFINGDNEFCEKVAGKSPVSVVTAGFHPGSDWCASRVKMTTDGMTFEVKSIQESWNGKYKVQFVGKHQVINALLALAVGAELGVGPAEARSALEQCPPSKMRLELYRIGEVTILDDAYNANADSTIAALETLRDVATSGRKIAVLGDMAELGRHSDDAHTEVGRFAASCGIDDLFAVGGQASLIVSAARKAGLASARNFPDVELASPVIQSCLRGGDILLLKASRASRLERITEFLGRKTP